MKLTTQLYYNLIISAEQRQLPDNVYTEKHHVIPKCVSKKDSILSLELKNLTVKLTAKEHFYVHYLLTDMYKDDKKNISGIWRAFWKLCNKKGSKGQKRDYIVKAKIYEKQSYTLVIQ